ncbi:hypothetical protein EDC01DRAFT_629618 [Geopyxis carbonaria]|nr:hypothetical protein EDC01DRAFT_629618 [Geopyxis carbonaria]
MPRPISTELAPNTTSGLPSYTSPPSSVAPPDIAPSPSPSNNPRFTSLLVRIGLGGVETNCVICGHHFRADAAELARNGGSRCVRCRKRIERQTKQWSEGRSERDREREEKRERDGEIEQWARGTENANEEEGEVLKGGEGNGASRWREEDITWDSDSNPGEDENVSSNVEKKEEEEPKEDNAGKTKRLSNFRSRLGSFMGRDKK